MLLHVLCVDVVVHVPAEMEVREPEVVTPFRHAMHLIDDAVGEIDAHLVHRLQPLAELVDAEPLGREEDELQLGCLQAPLGRAPLVRRDRRVDVRAGVDTSFDEPLILVLHERAERVDDDRHAWLEHRGKLVRQGLSASGGKQAYDALVLQRPVQDGHLAGPEVALPEKQVEEVREVPFLLRVCLEIALPACRAHRHVLDGVRRVDAPRRSDRAC